MHAKTSVATSCNRRHSFLISNLLSLPSNVAFSTLSLAAAPARLDNDFQNPTQFDDCQGAGGLEAILRDLHRGTKRYLGVG